MVYATDEQQNSLLRTAIPFEERGNIAGESDAFLHSLELWQAIQHCMKGRGLHSLYSNRNEAGVGKSYTLFCKNNFIRMRALNLVGN